MLYLHNTHFEVKKKEAEETAPKPDPTTDILHTRIGFVTVRLVLVL